MIIPVFLVHNNVFSSVDPLLIMASILNCQLMYTSLMTIHLNTHFFLLTSNFLIVLFNELVIKYLFELLIMNQRACFEKI